MNHRAITLAAAFSLSLHILVPPGFMPASVGDGWFLKWCPNGMSSQTMHALFGHAHHHHSNDEPSFEHCGLSADADFQTVDSLNGNEPGVDSARPTLQSLYRSETRSGYLPRAPPAPTPV